MNKQNSFGNYKKIRDSYNLEIPEFYNFGFDVIEKRALEDDKTAFIYVSRDGSKIETKTRYLAIEFRFVRIILKHLNFPVKVIAKRFDQISYLLNILQRT